MFLLCLNPALRTAMILSGMSQVVCCWLATDCLLPDSAACCLTVLPGSAPAGQCPPYCGWSCWSRAVCRRAAVTSRPAPQRRRRRRRRGTSGGNQGALTIGRQSRLAAGITGGSPHHLPPAATPHNKRSADRKKYKKARLLAVSHLLHKN